MSHIDVLMQEIGELKEENASLLNEKTQLQREIQTATDYIVEIEEKCYQSNQTCVELLQQMRNLDKACELRVKKLKEKHSLEAETLKAYILDIKARIPNYIPVKGDEIDQVLAQYINNYPDKSKLKLMFMRQQEGQYEFGSRNLILKVMRGSI